MQETLQGPTTKSKENSRKKTEEKTTREVQQTKRTQHQITSNQPTTAPKTPTETPQNLGTGSFSLHAPLRPGIAALLYGGAGERLVTGEGKGLKGGKAWFCCVFLFISFWKCQIYSCAITGLVIFLCFGVVLHSCTHIHFWSQAFKHGVNIYLNVYRKNELLWFNQGLLFDLAAVRIPAGAMFVYGPLPVCFWFQDCWCKWGMNIESGGRTDMHKSQPFGWYQNV